MNPIQELEKEVRGIFPDATMTIDEPELETAPWWLDIKYNGQHFTVEWRQGRGFGFSTVTPEAVYGEGPEHVVGTADEVIECLLASAAVAA